MKKIRPLDYILAYLFWFATIGIGVSAAMAVRDTVRFVLILAGLHRYAIHANSLVAALLLGIVLLIYIVIAEHLYRTAVPKGILMSRFCLFTGWTLLLLALMHIIQVAVVFLDSSAIDSFRLSVALIELIVGFAALWLQNMMRYWGSKNKNMH